MIGKTDDAIIEYQEAARLRPNDANIHFNLAIAYQNKKDLTVRDRGVEDRHPSLRPTGFRLT